jgi:signal transduction histidine kinase/CheY-like chemotaxis protein
VLLIAAVSLTATLIVAQKNAEDWVMHTLRVEDELSRVRILMLQAEVFKRGFVLGGNDDLRTRALVLQQEVEPALANLQRMIVDNPDQQQRIGELHRLYRERSAITREILELAARGERAKASDVALSHTNAGRQERWALIISAADAAERKLLADRQLAASKFERPVEITIACSGLLLLAMVCIFASDRRRKMLELRVLNDQLEQDINRRTQLEVELVDARKNAEAAARGKANFLANMSHEIRTPMNGVLGFTDLLLSGRLEPEQRRHAQLIADSGKAMMRLLNDILDLSKIEAGQMQVAPEHVDLRHKIHNCVKLLKPAAEQKHLELRCDIDGSVPQFALVDGLRLRQIILNLVGNAVKFTHEGFVAVSARIEDHGADCFLQVQVADTGIGIPAEKQAVIFQDFVQAENTIAARFGGTGLGLAISKKLAEMMGGTLQLESELGCGTTFTLKVPIEFASALPSEQSEAEGSGGASLGGVHVLLAEDHDVNQELMQAMLRHLGHTVTIVADGAQALDAARAKAESGRGFDLVLMDMQMPVMDGLAATRAIREAGLDAKALPIIALTANAYADDIVNCLSAGMQAHMTKPVQIQQLNTVIRKWTAKDTSTTQSPATLISPALQEKYTVRKNDLRAFAEGLSGKEMFDNESMKQLQSMLHKLAGSAGMFHEPGLGLQALELELALKEVSISARREVVDRVLALPLVA